MSDALSTIGLPLGGSEDWADRLYIVTKGGALLFDDDELDMAEEAQKRMEVHTMGRAPDAADSQRTAHMPHPPHAPLLLLPPQVMYNVDAWSAQLETRIANGSLLLNRPTNLGRPGGSQEEAFARALARLEADLKYHREIFVEPTSR